MRNLLLEHIDYLPFMERHEESHRYNSFAEQYARLGFTDTYYLACRDVPALIEQYKIMLGDGIDHGCGAGRATRLLKELGFKIVGVDRNAEMLSHARESDPSGDYRLISDEMLNGIRDQSVDFIFQSSVLEEYSSTNSMIETFKEFHRVLRPHGKVMIVTASEDLPKGTWASFTYPESDKKLQSGQQVKCHVRNSSIVFSDYYWTDFDLKHAFESGGLEILLHHRPFADGQEKFHWYDEIKRSPWSVYILQKKLL